MPHLIREIQTRDTEIAKLKEQVDGFNAAAPAVGSGVGVSDDPGGDDSGKSFLQRMGVRDYNAE